jgi:hypothetical protein
MLRASSCPSSGEQYKTDNAYGVQHWPCGSRLEEKRWFGVHLLGMVSRLRKPDGGCGFVQFFFRFWTLRIFLPVGH